MGPLMLFLFAFRIPGENARIPEDTRFMDLHTLDTPFTLLFTSVLSYVLTQKTV